MGSLDLFVEQLSIVMNCNTLLAEERKRKFVITDNCPKNRAAEVEFLSDLQLLCFKIQ